MRIKSLEIKGFKSFPDKTVFDFKPGITSVVGPNGCGKSNVLEAIRWVIGEQRVKTLRSKKMEDVIFNGSESRKPVGMSEVRLILSNSGKFCPPEMSDYDEIMITRRLFRDGESNYEINNIACRLADIVDFFLDTGVGKNSYAIIEQGRVDMIVASKPEDRRVLIEEAAGIGRYKSRKEAALKKLDQTKQNLLRINDIIAEVKHQSSALKRQAAKAERYRKLTESLREKDLGLNAHKCMQLESRLETVIAELNERRDILVQKEAQTAETGSKLEQTRIRIIDIENDLRTLLESKHATELDLAAVRNGIASGRTRVQQLKDHEVHARRERDDQLALLTEASKSVDDLAKEKAAVEDELRMASTLLKEALGEIKQKDSALSSAGKDLERLKDDFFQCLQDISKEKNSQELLKRRKKEIHLVMQKRRNECESLSEALDEFTTEKSILTSSLYDLDNESARNAERLAQLTGIRQTREQELKSLRAKISALEKTFYELSATAESLRGIKRDYAEYDDAVKFVMQSFGSCGSFLGTPAEGLDVEAEYETALAAALGHRLNSIVVDSVTDAANASQKLKEHKAGRAIFIPRGPENMVRPNRDCGLTPLLSVVSVKDEFRPVAEFLVGNFFLAESVEQALDSWTKLKPDFDMVTPDGFVIKSTGEVQGGVKDALQNGIFQRQREIALTEQSLQKNQEELDAISSAKDESSTAMDKIIAEMAALQDVMNEGKIKQAQLRKDYDHLAREIRQTERKLEVLKLEVMDLEKEAEGLDTDGEASGELLDRLEQKKLKIAEKQRKAKELESVLASDTKRISKLIGELRVKTATFQEKSKGAAKNLSDAHEQIRRCEKRIAVLSAEMEKNSKELAAVETSFSDLYEQEKELMIRHETLGSRIENLQDDSRILSGELKRLQEDYSVLSAFAKENSSAVHNLEKETIRVEQTLNDIVEKIVERYQMDPRLVPSPEIPPDESEIADLRRKIETIGEVNLSAIAESRRIDERLAFLTEQEDDLNKAVASLFDTINKINKTTKERFRTTFDKVNEKFGEIFPFLFRGGEAKLVLTDEEDILETGVEIMVRPPGKRIQNMDLLSGGEKALTAVGLIFSIFLIRPSPFCLLDEVDAPLDEANLVRFNEMLRKLSDLTQFIVVTHNRRSMEEADSLYGITMEEPGVSRVVSVEFV